MRRCPGLRPSLLLLFAVGGLGCASPESAPGEREAEVVPVADEQPEGDGDGEGDPAAVPLPPPTLPPFPTVELFGEDAEWVVQGGPFDGYLSRFYKVRNQSGAALIPFLNRVKTAQAKLVPINDQNILWITETVENMPRLLRLLKELDVVPSQIEIEAKVVEIQETAGLEYGFEFLLDKSPAGDTLLRQVDSNYSSSSFLESLTNTTAPFQGSTLNFASVGDVAEEFGDFELILRALQSEGYAEIVSSPRIVTRSGVKAVLNTKTKLPINDFVQQNTTTRITTRFTDVGVTLEVTPQVVGRDAISAEVRAKVSNVIRFEFTNVAGGVPIPVIATRTLATRVDIRNEELLVIGGLLDRQLRQTTRGVPVLRSIPLLGRLFESLDDNEERTNLVFVLRLRILTDAAKAAGRAAVPLTKEDRARINAGEEREDVQQDAVDPESGRRAGE